MCFKGGFITKMLVMNTQPVFWADPKKQLGFFVCKTYPIVPHFKALVTLKQEFFYNPKTIALAAIILS